MDMGSFTTLASGGGDLLPLPQWAVHLDTLIELMTPPNSQSSSTNTSIKAILVAIEAKKFGIICITCSLQQVVPVISWKMKDVFQALSPEQLNLQVLQTCCINELL